MNYASQYQTPPPRWTPGDFHGHSSSNYPPPPNYYSPRYGTATPSPRESPKVSAHHRRASHAVPNAVPPQYSSYASPRGAQYDGFSPRNYASQQRAPDYVSGGFDYVRPSRPRRDTDVPPLKRFNRERRHRPSQSQSQRRYVNKVYYDDEYVYESPPPPYEQYARYEAYVDANGYYHRQMPIYTDTKKTTTSSSNRRRASHSGGSKPSPEKRQSAARPKPQATEEDARRAGIPAGYSYKNWDPTEEPIVLLGSVFDANSLGKWIYDWAVHHSEPASPISEMAGELWLLLIQLAGKVKRAEETMKKIRKQESRELVEDFLESGDRLWDRFCKMLKACEEYMWKLAQKETGEKKPASLGKNSGLDFVDSLFGRDQQLEKLEKWMTGARLWGMRFDANCEDILRYPSA
ncbi:hypothetical protein BU24DRAFT_418293 [Aaosphaeria arxii CBS 175.79]|uniref:Vegetative cell wall protein gp1 n=1 Tax=Aaosphaeria arxii CBS 175.79 TaxID=1450172 RepID=A0A6A5XZL5_9PLEO|nr:uncharacterized protein BU24DRAFT_418293 [Aaosphaeria arxii CBS 175.79]KAF2018745.1 hypothetical protein BU24DRAFT_418293 [Aaosphaeria arxii CBS 175.79]